MNLRSSRDATRGTWPMTALIGASAVVATAGLHAVFERWSFLGASVAGMLVALAAVQVGRAARLLIGETVALAIGLFVVVGIIVVGGSPTPGAARVFFRGLVDAWADMVSATQPADLTNTLRIVPFALAWVGALLGGELARRGRTPSLPVVGPLLTLALAVLLSAEERRVAVAQGTVLAIAALAMGLVQQRDLRRRAELGSAGDGEARGVGRTLQRGIRAGAMLAVIAVLAPIVGPRLPLAEANERYDLRDKRTPPWDPLAVPSPLVDLKASLAEGRRDDVVFRVQADAPIDRWQLAVLGDYDGIVWSVGDGASADAANPATADFRSVDSRLPDAPADVRSGHTVSATVTVTDLGDPWLPTPGWTTTLHPDAGGPNDIRADLRTGTLAVPGGVRAGMRYDITAYAPPSLSDDALEQHSVTATQPNDELSGLPPAVRNLAADLLEGQNLGWAQVVSVRDAFRGSGFYDSTTNVPPGHSYFRLAEFLADKDRIVGYEEQYAAAAAVILSAARVPTRIVVGYRVPADRWVGGQAEVRAGDISAWVEVRVDGIGWVPADVTPDRTRTPTADEQGTVFQDVATPNPPPPPQLPPSVDVITNDDDTDEADDPDTADRLDVAADVAVGLSPGPFIAGAAGGILILALLVAAGVVLAKQRRRRRRRTADEPAARVAGAWLELADRCREAGVPLAEQATPLEAARAYLSTEPSAPAVRTELLGLVAVVDRAAFHPQPPGDERAERAWQYSDHVAAALVRDRSRRERLTMRLDPRTLRRRDPAAREPVGTG